MAAEERGQGAVMTDLVEVTDNCRGEGVAKLSSVFRQPFYRYSFFQAVTLLERRRRDKKKLGQAVSPKEEAVRFAAKTGLAFPASDLSDLREGMEGAPVRMEVAFLGLIGPSGVLPHWYHELVLERAAQNDHAMAAFYDIFHHRLITLFYLAWKRRRVAASKEPDHSDRFTGYLLSLMGLGNGGRGVEAGFRGDVPLFFGGALARQVPTAATVAAVVRHRFRVAAEVEQFIPRAVVLEPEDRCALGRRNNGLGVDAVCGVEACDVQSTFRVTLGPMPYRDFIRFLPGGERLKSLVALVRYMVGIEYEFEVRLVLDKNEVPSCRLGERSPDGPRLGWTTWMAQPGKALPADPCLTLQELEAAAS